MLKQIVSVSLGSSRSATPAFSSPTGHQSSLSPCVASSPIASFGLNNSNVFMPISNQEKSETAVNISHLHKWHQSPTRTNFFIQYNNDLQVVKPEPSRMIHQQKYSSPVNSLSSLTTSVIRISPVGNAKEMPPKQSQLDSLNKKLQFDPPSITPREDKKTFNVEDNNSQKNSSEVSNSPNIVETIHFSAPCEIPYCINRKEKKNAMDKYDKVKLSFKPSTQLSSCGTDCKLDNSFAVIKKSANVTVKNTSLDKNCKMQHQNCIVELSPMKKHNFQFANSSSLNLKNVLNPASKEKENFQVNL